MAIWGGSGGGWSGAGVEQEWSQVIEFLAEEKIKSTTRCLPEAARWRFKGISVTQVTA